MILYPNIICVPKIGRLNLINSENIMQTTLGDLAILVIRSTAFGAVIVDGTCSLHLALHQSSAVEFGLMFQKMQFLIWILCAMPHYRTDRSSDTSRCQVLRKPLCDARRHIHTDVVHTGPVVSAISQWQKSQYVIHQIITTDRAWALPGDKKRN